MTCAMQEQTWDMGPKCKPLRMIHRGGVDVTKANAEEWAKALKIEPPPGPLKMRALGVRSTVPLL